MNSFSIIFVCFSFLCLSVELFRLLTVWLFTWPINKQELNWIIIIIIISGSRNIVVVLVVMPVPVAVRSKA